jgi:hypothetical protein
MRIQACTLAYPNQEQQPSGPGHWLPSAQIITDGVCRVEAHVQQTEPAVSVVSYSTSQIRLIKTRLPDCGAAMTADAHAKWVKRCLQSRCDIRCLIRREFLLFALADSQQNSKSHVCLSATFVSQSYVYASLAFTCQKQRTISSLLTIFCHKRHHFQLASFCCDVKDFAGRRYQTMHRIPSFRKASGLVYAYCRHLS